RKNLVFTKKSLLFQKGFFQIKDKVQFFSKEKDRAFFVHFESFSWDKHHAASLRCRVALACFSLGSDFERTKTLLSFSFKLLRTEKQYDILADVYKTNPHFKIDSFSLHPIKFGYYHLIWTKIDYNNFCEKIYKHD
ncbi:MAG: hypothetical protein ACOVQU_02680, partial [Exiguobacterium acetylicum]